MIIQIRQVSVIVCFMLAFALSSPFLSFADDVTTWLTYDEGEAAHESSGFPFQGVRFSLPDDVVSAPLLTIRFFYKTALEFCPVTIHVTYHDHQSALIPSFQYNAVNGWNSLDMTLHGISAPHNFYVILENTGCGSPILDGGASSGRSFKGLHLESLTTRFSQNLLIQSEVGAPIEVPIDQQWDVVVNEKITIDIEKEKKQTVQNAYNEQWTLYEDGSFGMEDGPFGLWFLQGKKYLFVLDPEDIVESIEGSLTDLPEHEITGILVTKSSFAGKVKKSGTIKGSWKVYSSITLEPESTFGKIIIEKKYTASPQEL